MSLIKTEQVRKSQIDENGNEIIDTYEKTVKIEQSTEPDYIKLYTKMWCEFNEIPEKYRQLFLSLAVRMEYCNLMSADDKDGLQGSQIVAITFPHKEAIMAECGWKTADPLWKGLRVLCEYNAIRRIRRAIYQINPNYAGRGSWKYNPKLEQGGIEDLVTTFSFKDKTVKTNVIFKNGDRDYTHKQVTVEDIIDNITENPYNVIENHEKTAWKKDLEHDVTEEALETMKTAITEPTEEKPKKKRGRKKKSETAA